MQRLADSAFSVTQILDFLGLLQPYRISFDKPDYGSIYYQCVYMLCHQDDPTMKAGTQSKEAFSQDANSAYMPHLSLLYSDIDDHIRQATMHVCMNNQSKCTLEATCCVCV